MSRSSDAIRVATQRPGRFPHASLGTLLWCTVVWVMLWGEVTPGNIISGFVLALAITSLAPFPAMRLRWPLPAPCPRDTGYPFPLRPCGVLN